jgi:hypothetical protein
MQSNSTLVKILYVIPEGEEDAGGAEGLWAIPLGNQLFELQNIPVYAEYLNVEDIVFMVEACCDFGLPTCGDCRTPGSDLGTRVRGAG